MPLHAAINHVTRYRYNQPVSMSPQVIRLRPAPHSRTPVQSYSLKIEPAQHFINWQQDAFGNYLARVVFDKPLTEFVVTVDCVTDIAVYNPFDFFIEEYAEHVPFSYNDALAEDLKPYLRLDDTGPLFAAYLKTIAQVPDTRTVDFLVALNSRLQADIGYTIRMEPGVQTPEETLKKATGSCRDTGWLLVQLLRHLGYAARFVSGYLIQLTPDVKSLDGPSGTDKDFTDLHAWCEVYLPGAGWVGLDPTSGLFAGEGHIPLCATPEPTTAAPVSGSYSYSKTADAPEVTVEFEHHMAVSRVLETPRITKPYSEAEWAAINAVGEAIDVQLNKADVRLTMGGEPTFISADDYQAAEWNTAAVGPTKQGLANHLLLRLREQFAPGALLTHGQGKWYPGESLPRWAYSMTWRKDGQPILKAPQVGSVDTSNDLGQGPRHEAQNQQAAKLAKGVATRLGVDPDNAQPAFEDVYHYLHREQRLPPNVDVLNSKLNDAEERTRLSNVFERGLNLPRGYVLPVQRWQSRAWVSEYWRPRTGKLQLLPGDSPVGYRLPLEALPWVPDSALQVFPNADPFSSFAPLPARYPQPFLQKTAVATPAAAAQAQKGQRLMTDASIAPKSSGKYLDGIVRTALTVEPRGDYLYVFMPPTQSADDYLELVAAVEDCAAELNAPVRIEGYPPPYDPRFESLKITPDPGVIEVNVQPAASWAELRHITETIYEQARLSRLATEKFLVDGRSVGTGGGAHLVVGGATPADSPFLRRPDLVGSLVRFWQNHPALSYFFSGLFIGPTSQHPRVDEARDSNLYELEIALAQLPAKGTPDVPYWQVDRILRHLLTDLTGNTHRAEICIDKLYSPDSATGRLGLLEFRGFEMPPHARMNLAQQLLLRGLIAKFWHTPYTAPLIRWGTALHDRFLLPHFLKKDLCSVLAELRAGGFAFEERWFAPHFEFRFPLHGTLNFDEVKIEFRHALECWPTLGEEPGAGGTARYVDSSLERMQIKASGLTPGRHHITVAGRCLPLTSTGVLGEAVAGVRYRAWQPSSCLHPTIGIHTPLVIDLYDRYSQRAVAGATYHVMHPAGRSYDQFPVNAYEAEARRLSRFQAFGHTPGPYVPVEEPVNPDYPMTLDLRRG